MASDNVFLTALGNGSQVPITGTNRGGGTGDENPVARLRTTLTKLLGGDDSLTMTTSQAVDLDAYQGAPHAAMGLQVAVSGRATVVNADGRFSRCHLPHGAALRRANPRNRDPQLPST